MATTVTYKGQTLATVENQTKTLQTAGTWCEDDFTLTDVTQGGAGEWTTDGIANGTEPNGAITISTATTINEYAFSHRTGITSVTAPNVTRIMQYAFQYGATFPITSTSFPSLTTVDNNAFRNARINSIDITNTAQLLKGNRPYGDNNRLTTALFKGNTGDVGPQCFYSCASLTVLDIGFATKINNNAFNGCPLAALIIRTTTVCPLDNVNAFNNTPFKSGGTGGEIFVPSALLSVYPTSTNWSTVNGYGTITWKAIEGSIYE